jgi:BMFP domain-containing protein YqiC
VPPRILVDLIQHPGDTVMDAVRTSVSAGQRTVEQMSGEVGRLFGNVAGHAGRGAKKAGDAASDVAHAVEERLRAVIAELGLATREEINQLAARVETLEAKSTKSARPVAKKPPVRAKRPQGRRKEKAS